VRRSLLAEAFPSIGKRPVRDLTPTDVLACLRKIEARGAIEVAHRTAQRISAVCRYAVNTGRATVNPASDLRGKLKTRDVRPQPALPLDEVGDFLVRLDDYEGDPATKLGLRLIVLTALRTSELRGGRWNEVDFADGVWRISSERMKITPFRCRRTLSRCRGRGARTRVTRDNQQPAPLAG
jgi:integrase